VIAPIGQSSYELLAPHTGESISVTSRSPRPARSSSCSTWRRRRR